MAYKKLKSPLARPDAFPAAQSALVRSGFLIDRVSSFFPAIWCRIRAGQGRAQRGSTRCCQVATTIHAAGSGIARIKEGPGSLGEHALQADVLLRFGERAQLNYLTRSHQAVHTRDRKATDAVDKPEPEKGRYGRGV